MKLIHLFGYYICLDEAQWIKLNTEYNFTEEKCEKCVIPLIDEVGVFGLVYNNGKNLYFLIWQSNSYFLIKENQIEAILLFSVVNWPKV